LRAPGFQFDGPDKYFRSIEQVIDDSEFVCNAELLAQVVANRGNKVYRYTKRHVH
jgi:hypothetical protein